MLIGEVLLSLTEGSAWRPRSPRALMSGRHRHDGLDPAPPALARSHDDHVVAADEVADADLLACGDGAAEQPDDQLARRVLWRHVLAGDPAGDLPRLCPAGYL